MNIYRQELRAQCRTALIWAASLVALAALMLSIYPGMVKDVDDYRRLIEVYPAPVRAMLGGRMDAIATLPGFYAMVFSFIAVCGAIQAMNLGLSLWGREFRGHTADFLLAKPVSRTGVLTAKLLAGLTTLLLTNILYEAAVWAMAGAAAPSGFNRERFFALNLSLLLLQLIFMALGAALSLVFTRLRAATPVSIGGVFALYMLGTLSAGTRADRLGHVLSPFRYFDTGHILSHGTYEAAYLALGAAVTAAAVLAAYILARRDIRAGN